MVSYNRWRVPWFWQQKEQQVITNGMKLCDKANKDGHNLILQTLHLLFVPHLVQANCLLDPHLVPQPRLGQHFVIQTLHLLFVHHLVHANRLLDPHLVHQPPLDLHIYFKLFIFCLFHTLFKLIICLIHILFLNLVLVTTSYF